MRVRAYGAASATIDVESKPLTASTAAVGLLRLTVTEARMLATVVERERAAQANGGGAGAADEGDAVGEDQGPLVHVLQVIMRLIRILFQIRCGTPPPAARRGATC